MLNTLHRVPNYDTLTRNLFLYLFHRWGKIFRRGKVAYSSRLSGGSRIWTLPTLLSLPLFPLRASQAPPAVFSFHPFCYQKKQCLACGDTCGRRALRQGLELGFRVFGHPWWPQWLSAYHPAWMNCRNEDVQGHEGSILKMRNDDSSEC